MKNDYNREWLENYKTIPKRDNAIYKNYQNPGMSTWDRQMASLSSAQRNRYNEFLNTIPNELKGLSAAEMQKYLQGVDEKQNALAHERASYESQIQNIKNQEAKRQAQLQMARDLSRPMQWRMNGPSGSPPLAYFTDNNTLIPFETILQKMKSGGYDQSWYEKVYKGYGRTQDPYRPFIGTSQGFHYLVNSSPVPNSVIEKYKSKGNFRNAWYPMLEDT